MYQGQLPFTFSLTYSYLLAAQEKIRFQSVCMLLSDVSVVLFLTLFSVLLWEIALGVTNYESSNDITSVCDRHIEPCLESHCLLISTNRPLTHSCFLSVRKLLCFLSRLQAIGLY